MRRIICSAHPDTAKSTVLGNTRNRISSIEDRISKIEDALADPYIDDDLRWSLNEDLAILQQDLKEAWADDEQEWRYAVDQQEFNPDGSLKGYGDEVYSSTVMAKYDFSEPMDTEIQSGLFWDIDGHRIEVISRIGSLQCKVRESWIAEDTGEEKEDISMYHIGVDNSNGVRSEYIYDPKYPDYKMYAGSAFNYPYDEEWDRKQQWKQASEEWQRQARKEYRDDDDYTPSSTRGGLQSFTPLGRSRNEHTRFHMIRRTQT